MERRVFAELQGGLCFGGEVRSFARNCVALPQVGQLLRVDLDG